MVNTYISKQTGKKVKILKEEESFYTLNDGVKIKKETFFKRYDKSDEIDPMEFLNPTSALDNLANQIKNVDPSQIINEPKHSTTIKMKPATVLSDNSRGQVDPVNNNTSEGIKISESQKQKMLDEYKMKQELGEDAIKPQFNEHPTSNQNDGYIEYEMPNRGEGSIREISTNTPTTSTPSTSIDPLQIMFKMFKNNYDIKLNFQVKEKIADPAFIEMIMENVEGDAIEFYTKKILDKILKDPLKLKKEIYNQLELEIYGEEYITNKLNEKLEKEKKLENNSEKEQE